MRTFWQNDHTIRLSLLGVCVSLLYLTVLAPVSSLFPPFGFLQVPRDASQDLLVRWRNDLQPPPPQAKEILLVTIDDESQRQLNKKWPWDRMFFADFLQRIAQRHPKVVFFDIVFSGEGSAASDAALADAIQQATQDGILVLLGASYDFLKGDFQVFPHPLFEEAGGVVGNISKARDRSDSVVRRMFTSVRHPEPHRLLPLYAVEVTAAAASLGIPIEEIRITPGFLHLGPRRIPSKYRELPINFLISQNELSSLPFWQVLRGNIPPELVRDKLVFIGDNREITHDVHLTPLGQTPGVVIGINGFLTLVTQRHWKEIPLWITLPAAFVLTMGIVLLTFYGPVPWSLLAALAVMVLAVGLEFFLICRDFSTEFFSPLFLIGLAWLTGFSYKYGWLVASAIRLQRQAITDSFTGAYTARYFHLRLQEELHRSRMGKLPISLILIQIASPSQLLQSQPLEVVEGRIRSLVHTLREGIPEGTFLARLQEDRLGALLPKTSLAQATRAAEKLKESLRSIPEAVAFSVACTDQGLGKSADTVLRCAEAALSRASSNSASFLQVYDPSVDKVPLAPEGETPLKKKAANLDYVASELEERNRALENSLVELRKVHKELESAFLEVTKSLVLALETKDAYTAGHLERVSRYSTRLAQGMGLSKEEVEAVQEAALLHDIGKIGLPDEVLHKVGKLTDEEREIIKQHLMIGAKILEPMEFFKPITTLIYHHHEWYDGNGYPHGLAGDFIPPGAQIISIADAFDAMTTHRGYNKPLTPQEAVDEIKRCSGTQFNPVLVDKFSQIILQEGPHLAGHKAA